MLLLLLFLFLACKVRDTKPDESLTEVKRENDGGEGGVVKRSFSFDISRGFKTKNEKHCKQVELLPAN